MSKILIDTNVIIDLLTKRGDHYKSSLALFSLADRNEIQLVISPLIIANTHYLLNDVMKITESRAVMRKFKVLVDSFASTI